jgi:hypothetical protein
MAGRGGFNAVTPEQMGRLLAIRSDDDLDDEACDAAILEEVSRVEAEIGYDSPYFHDADKAWDAIHRCLTGDQTPDGRVNPAPGHSPLGLCVLGGEQLVEADHHTVALVRPEQVPGVAAALAEIDRAGMQERFFGIDREFVTDCPIDDAEFEYTWSNFAGLPELYRRAAAEGRAVLFVADH